MLVKNHIKMFLRLQQKINVVLYVAKKKKENKTRKSQLKALVNSPNAE